MKIKEMSDVLNGYAFKSSNYINDGYRIIRITNVQSGYIEDEKPVYYEYDNKLEKYDLQENDLLISLTGNVGRCALVTRKFLPAYLNQRVCCLRVNEKIVLPKFLYYILNSKKFEFDCINSSQGIAQLNMSTEWLKKYNLEIPTIELQEKIINIFDKVYNNIDIKKNQINFCNNLIKSQFVEMFGDPKLNEKKWIKAPMGDYMTVLTDFSSNGSYKTLDSTVVMYDEPQYAYMVRTTDLENDDYKNNVKYITKEAYNFLSKSKVYPNDIIMNKIGSAGKVYIMPDVGMPVSLGRNAFLFRYNDDIVPLFIYYLLKSEYGTNEISQYVRGAVTKTITKDDVRKVKIIVPPIELQNKFASIVEQIDKQKFVNANLLQLLGKNLKRCYNNIIDFR